MVKIVLWAHFTFKIHFQPFIYFFLCVNLLSLSHHYQRYMYIYTQKLCTSVWVTWNGKHRSPSSGKTIHNECVIGWAQDVGTKLFPHYYHQKLKGGWVCCKLYYVCVCLCMFMCLSQRHVYIMWRLNCVQTISSYNSSSSTFTPTVSCTFSIKDSFLLS